MEIIPIHNQGCQVRARIASIPQNTENLIFSYLNKATEAFNGGIESTLQTYNTTIQISKLGLIMELLRTSIPDINLLMNTILLLKRAIASLPLIASKATWIFFAS